MWEDRVKDEREREWYVQMRKGILGREYTDMIRTKVSQLSVSSEGKSHLLLMSEQEAPGKN